MRSFWYHYNKPASKKAGYPQITLHYKNQCLLVNNLECNVPTKGRIRKSQPFFVVAGLASNIKIKNNVAIII